MVVDEGGGARIVDAVGHGEKGIVNRIDAELLEIESSCCYMRVEHRLERQQSK